MKIKIKHKGSEVEIENNYTYGSYIDVKDFVLSVIENTIDTLNKK